MTDIDEYRAMLDEVTAGSASTGERSAQLLALLRDAEQAQRPFARQIIEEATLAGLAKTIKTHQKANAMVTVKKVPKSTVIGVRRAGQWHQVPLTETTWDELSVSADLAKANASAIRANVRIINRLMKLRDLAPESSGPGDALTRIGTSLEQFLEAA